MMGRVSPEGHTVKMETETCAGPQRSQSPELRPSLTSSTVGGKSRSQCGEQVLGNSDFQHSFTCILPLGHFRLKTAGILICN